MGVSLHSTYQIKEYCSVISLILLKTSGICYGMVSLPIVCASLEVKPPVRSEAEATTVPDPQKNVCDGV
jgi:hypothetical protein